MISMVVTRHLVITGLVQGEWYRESLREAAERLGVKGWVRNRLDGSVEAVAHGEAESVATLIDWARQGPPPGPRRECGGKRIDRGFPMLRETPLRMNLYRSRETISDKMTPALQPSPPSLS